jgi:DNA repair exonuclease SbcCD ATPase subunit
MRKITHIYHLADLHIRNLKRHSEYRLIFNQFLEKVKSDNIEDSIIYLAGDIAHAKTEMSPELIQEISWFLTECSKLKETILITGNHDCNLNNSHRLDVLTPIINNLDNPHIHYYRDTGIYNYHNLTFVVYSILDKKENWPLGKDIEGENKICLFHGPVNKSQTDVGYVVSSNSFTTDMFEGFDMVLMGDIHKRQTLQPYNPSKKEPIVVYAGSLVQQNHGELLNGHGYLLWDIEKRTFEEFDIPNDFGYLTIDVYKGNIPQWVYDESDTLPKNPRLRLRFNETDATTTKACITELSKIFKTTEITVSRMDTMAKLRSNNGLNNGIVGNVKDETFQNHLITDYLDRRYLLEETHLDAISEINKLTNQKVSANNRMDNILWIPKKLEFSNMFSYGETNLVRFDNAKGIVGIFAPNASGKSSLFDILSFCIFDKTSRTSSSKNILNNQKENFYSKFEFEIDGISYFIERIAKLNKTQTSVKVDVNFWRNIDGVDESLNGEQRRDTNKNIETYLGNFEDFILTTLSLQGNNALFIDKSQSERKEVLSQLIGIDIFDKLYQIASDDNRETSTLVKKFKSDDFPQKLASIETELDDCRVDYSKLNDDILELNKKEEELNESIIELKSQIINTGSFDYEITQLESNKTKLESSLQTQESTKSELNGRLEKLIPLEAQLSGLLNGLNESEIKDGISKLNTFKEQHRTAKNEIEKLEIKHNSLLDKKAHLDLHKYNPDCEICMDNSKSILTSKEEVVEAIQKIEDTIEEHTTELAQLKIEIDELISFEDKLKTLNDLKEKHNKVDKDIFNINSQISACDLHIHKIEGDIEKNAINIEEYYKNEEQIVSNQKIKKELGDLQTKMTNLKSDISNRDNTKMSIFKKQTTLESQRDVYQERINEVKDLEEKNKLYEYYLNALSKDGVSLELIEKAIPAIEGEINNILGQIVEFGMELELEGKNINANLVYGDSKWSLELCSGMERFISGLAIRIALINICNLPRPNFLVIDEGFGTLDNENLTSLYMLFSYLKTQFDFVMIISHIDSMRDVVDTLMEIKKVNGFSEVKF